MALMMHGSNLHIQCSFKLYYMVVSKVWILPVHSFCNSRTYKHLSTFSYYYRHSVFWEAYIHMKAAQTKDVYAI